MVDSTFSNFDVGSLLEDLVRIDSRNPDLCPKSPGEGPIAKHVARVLSRLGLAVSVVSAVGRRPNVIGVLPGTPGHATVVLEAHLDTVPADPETLRVYRRGRFLYGRGACDTKGSLAAMIGAVERVSHIHGTRPTIVLAGVADEEFVMRGAHALLQQLPHVDAVVVGEPTSLLPVRAHNGFIRVKAIVSGVAAHSSKAHLGVNAVTGAATVITMLESTLGTILRLNPDPLTGPAYLTATMIEGGIAPNVVPDRCEILFDRRLSPHETVEGALADLEGILEGLRQSQEIDVILDDPIVALAGFQAVADSPIIVAAQNAAARITGLDVPAGGVTYSTDACYLAGVGKMSCVVLGPGSIDQAHARVEWVDLDEVDLAVNIYVDLALEFDRLHHEIDCP